MLELKPLYAIDAPRSHASSQAPQDEGLYEAYCRRGEYCSICNALGRVGEFVCKEGEGYLCREHFNLYKNKLSEIRAGRAEFPPECNANTKRVYLEDETIWMKLSVLEIMVDRKKITLEKAQEQMAAIIDLYNQGCMTPAEYQQWLSQKKRERAQKMLPDTHLY